MSRIEMIDPDDATGDVAVLFDAVEGDAWSGSKLVSRHCPVTAHRQNARPRQRGAPASGRRQHLTTKIKEMVVIKTSHINGCAY